ncbi:TreTu family toxin [Cellulomonas wangsupingiae]|uniref:TreTu family toxin n=1 Tax=Cellulomonas wangsupingiae TaxID=2968085 RepID=UPI003D69D55D
MCGDAGPCRTDGRPQGGDSSNWRRLSCSTTGDIYVEYEVPTAVLRPHSQGASIIYGPDSLQARLPGRAQPGPAAFGTSRYLADGNGKSPLRSCRSCR